MIFKGIYPPSFKEDRAPNGAVQYSCDTIGDPNPHFLKLPNGKIYVGFLTDKSDPTSFQGIDPKSIKKETNQDGSATYSCYTYGKGQATCLLTSEGRTYHGFYEHSQEVTASTGETRRSLATPSPTPEQLLNQPTPPNVLINDEEPRFVRNLEREAMYNSRIAAGMDQPSIQSTQRPRTKILLQKIADHQRSGEAPPPPTEQQINDFLNEDQDTFPRSTPYSSHANPLTGKVTPLDKTTDPGRTALPEGTINRPTFLNPPSNTQKNTSETTLDLSKPVRNFLANLKSKGHPTAAHPAPHQTRATTRDQNPKTKTQNPKAKAALALTIGLAAGLILAYAIYRTTS